MRGRLFSSVGLIGVVLITVVVVPLLALLLRGARLDLTDGQLHTLSDGTRSLLAGLSSEIELTVYFSDETTAGMPDLRNYARHVRDLLDEMAAQSGGKLQVVLQDPAPFSEAEDAAAAANLQSISANAAGDSIYLGLVGRGANGREEVIPFFQPDREQFLEYDIARLVGALDRKAAPVIGLVTTLPVDGQFDFHSGGQSGAWIAIAELSRQFDVQRPALADAGALAKLDVLVVIHPQRLQPQELFNLDQFVLRGGRLLLFVDPNADHQAGGNPMMPEPSRDPASNLAPLLAAWGIRYDPSKVVADARYAMTVTMSAQGPPVRHLGIMTLDGEAIDRTDPITAQLDRINFGSAGALAPVAGAKTTFTPLIRSSSDAAQLDAERFRMLMDPTTLADGFVPRGGPFTIAARVQGQARTAYPGGLPAAAATASPPAAAATATPPAAAVAATPPAAAGSPTAQPLRGTGTINVTVVADTDVLTDLLWVQLDEFFGQRVARPWASNGDFLLNAVENLSGSAALASIRGRARYQRPFTRVQDLMRRADERMIEQGRALENQLATTEQKLAALERSGQGGEGPQLTPAQQIELQRFQAEKLTIRKRLRQVQRELTVDIERLGDTVKLLNILAVPAVLLLLAVVFAIRRGQRRRTIAN